MVAVLLSIRVTVTPRFCQGSASTVSLCRIPKIEPGCTFGGKYLKSRRFGDDLSV